LKSNSNKVNERALITTTKKRHTRPQNYV